VSSRSDLEGAAAPDDRTIRALTEYIYAFDELGAAAGAPGLWLVYGEAGDEYFVDVRGCSCTCGDACHRDVRCKHIRRVEFLTGRRAVPEWADPGGIDPWLLEQLDQR
jgi:hypothetical protein